MEIGRVEICSHQRWNTFSTLHWFATNTRVACIELGFRGTYYYLRNPSNLSLGLHRLMCAVSQALHTKLRLTAVWNKHSTGYGGSITSFGGGGGPRFNQYFKCTGSEPRLSECQSFNETASRSSGYDVGIYCSLGTCILSAHLHCHRLCYVPQHIVLMES